MPTGGVNGETLIDVVDDGLAHDEIALAAISQDGDHPDVAPENLTVSARCAPVHLALWCQKRRGHPGRIAYRGTAGIHITLAGCPAPSKTAVWTRQAISWPSSGPNEALDRLSCPQRAISGHVSASDWRSLRIGGGDTTVVRPCPAADRYSPRQKEGRPTKGRPREIKRCAATHALALQRNGAWPARLRELVLLHGQGREELHAGLSADRRGELGGVAGGIRGGGGDVGIQRV